MARTRIRPPLSIARGTQRRGVATARQVQGKELSYNNVNDTDAAFELAAEFDPAPDRRLCDHQACQSMRRRGRRELGRGLCARPAVRSGLGVWWHCRLKSPARCRSRRRDRQDFHGSHYRAGRRRRRPSHSSLPRKICGLLLTGGLPDPRAEGLTFRTVAGGFLAQSRDNANVDDMDLRVVSKRAPDAREWRDLKFAFRVAKHVKSNAIVYAKDGATVGIGAGQMSRVDSARIAAIKAAEAASGPPVCRKAWRKAPSSPRMRFFLSPTASLPPPKQARQRSFSPADQCATVMSSRPPMKKALRWFLPACGISAISHVHVSHACASFISALDEKRILTSCAFPHIFLFQNAMNFFQVRAVTNN